MTWDRVGDCQRMYATRESQYVARPACINPKSSEDKRRHTFTGWRVPDVRWEYSTRIQFIRTVMLLSRFVFTIVEVPLVPAVVRIVICMRPFALYNVNHLVL